MNFNQIGLHTTPPLNSIKNTNPGQIVAHRLILCSLLLILSLSSIPPHLYWCDIYNGVYRIQLLCPRVRFTFVDLAPQWIEQVDKITLYLNWDSCSHWSIFLSFRHEWCQICLSLLVFTVSLFYKLNKSTLFWWIWVGCSNSMF